MMRSFAYLAAIAAVLVLASSESPAAPVSYIAFLDGISEAPPNNSPGTGFTRVDLDIVAHTMRVRADFSGLVAGVTAAHIHTPTPAPGSGTAGVATTTPTFPNFPLGVTSGTYDMTFDLTLASSYNPAFITANGGTTADAERELVAGIAGGRAYLNIHTSTFPGGEIRGFLVPIPEPASLVMLAIGGLALGAVRFARRPGA